MGQDSDFKASLVSQICSFSRAPIACVHTKFHSYFTDWYRILGVEEDEKIDVIRKRYHKLALQTHPDKNEHPKAEMAFKLISEAYTCLSNDSKRKKFNSERWKSFCIHCNKIPSARKSRTNPSRAYRIFKDIRDRFKEEAKVIETCLKTYNTNTTTNNNTNSSSLSSNKERDTLLFQKSELPVFDPSDYVSNGYPHVRSRSYKKPEDFWFQRRDRMMVSPIERYSSPVFENKADWKVYTNKSASLPY